MAKQKKKSHKSASMVDLRKVHRADNAPDNPRTNTMLEDGNVGENVTTSPRRSIRLRNENPDVHPVVESDLTSIRGSDERKSELTFTQEEYKDDNPILLDDEMED